MGFFNKNDQYLYSVVCRHKYLRNFEKKWNDLTTVHLFIREKKRQQCPIITPLTKKRIVIWKIKMDLKAPELRCVDSN